MDSTYKLLFSEYFEHQFKKIKKKTLVEDKLRLLKQNPFRFKGLTGYHLVFEIKLRLNGYQRLIYTVNVKEKNILVFGLFPRKHEFKDFQRFYDRVMRTAGQNK